VIGSTKSPVEKRQRRIAPTPRPSIRAPIGYAMPARKLASRGAGSSGNEITWRQTTSGAAFTTLQTAAERVLDPTGLSGIVPPRQLVFAAVTFYLGANLLTQLVPDSREVEEILETGKRFAPLVDAFGGLLRAPDQAP